MFGPNMKKEDTSQTGGSALYDADYYASHCGPVAYDRSNPIWGVVVGVIADGIIRTFRPRRMVDAGCADAFVVEALWDRGRSQSSFERAKSRARGAECVA